MTTTAYPNGQVLISSALTVAQINAIMQPIVCGMLGLPVTAYQAVRMSWQTQGQPFVPTPANDVCFVSCVPENVDYHQVRDRTFTGTGPVTENWNYTRGWRVTFVFYGPNSTDHARAVHSAFFMDYFNDLLSLQNLYPVLDAAQPTRVPEEINAQFYERADFNITMYEAITETIEDAAVTSVEIKVNTKDASPAADFTVTKT